MMGTNLCGSLLLSLCIQSLEWKGDIFSQKLSVYVRQFGYREEKGAGGEKAIMWKDEYLKMPTATATAGLFTSTQPGWNRSVGIGLLKRKQNQMGRLLLGWHCSVVRNNWLCPPLAGAAGDAVKHRPRACGCERWNACVAQGLRRKCVAFH